MVLADTSVWIDYFNGVSTWQTERLDLLLDTDPVALGDLILTEVLQGFRNDADFRKAQSFLAELPFYELGGYAVCLQAARNYRALHAQSSGISSCCITTGTSTLCKRSLDYNWFGRDDSAKSSQHEGNGARISASRITITASAMARINQVLLE